MLRECWTTEELASSTELSDFKFVCSDADTDASISFSFSLSPLFRLDFVTLEILRIR